MSYDPSITIRSQNHFFGYVDVGRLLAPEDCNSIELGSMRESLPIRRLTAKIKGQPADAVIGEIVCEENRDLGIFVPFACPEGCADAGVATAYDKHSHRHPISNPNSCTLGTARV
jgi:hypothetical protein